MVKIIIEDMGNRESLCNRSDVTNNVTSIPGNYSPKTPKSSQNHLNASNKINQCIVEEPVQTSKEPNKVKKIVFSDN